MPGKTQQAVGGEGDFLSASMRPRRHAGEDRIKGNMDTEIATDMVLQ